MKRTEEQCRDAREKDVAKCVDELRRLGLWTPDPKHGEGWGLVALRGLWLAGRESMLEDAEEILDSLESAG